MNPTQKQIELYGQLKELVINIWSYDEQIMAIAIFIDENFTRNDECKTLKIYEL